jgi:hypothetical protein
LSVWWWLETEVLADLNPLSERSRSLGQLATLTSGQAAHAPMT